MKKEYAMGREWEVEDYDVDEKGQLLFPFVKKLIQKWVRPKETEAEKVYRTGRY